MIACYYSDQGNEALPAVVLLPRGRILLEQGSSPRFIIYFYDFIKRRKCFQEVRKSMSSFTFDCPNCSAKKSTFDLKGYERRNFADEMKNWYLFATCRCCKISMCFNSDVKNQRYYNLEIINRNVKSSIIKAISDDLNSNADLSNLFDNFKYTPILPNAEKPPEHLPAEVEAFFKEAAQCYAIGCYNASGAMFRLCLDITTKNIISQYEHLNPTNDDKKTIHSRLNWIFKNGILPKQLENLSRCIKDDGNDAAHDGSLSYEDASDLLDFTYILLERIYTEPARIENAHQRRVERRKA